MTANSSSSLPSRPSEIGRVSSGLSIPCVVGIPTVADRLLQRAVARILEAMIEADFLDCS